MRSCIFFISQRQSYQNILFFEYHAALNLNILMLKHYLALVIMIYDGKSSLMCKFLRNVYFVQNSNVIFPVFVCLSNWSKSSPRAVCSLFYVVYFGGFSIFLNTVNFSISVNTIYVYVCAYYRLPYSNFPYVSLSLSAKCLCAPRVCVCVCLCTLTIHCKCTVSTAVLNNAKSLRLTTEQTQWGLSAQDRCSMLCCAIHLCLCGQNKLQYMLVHADKQYPYMTEQIVGQLHMQDSVVFWQSTHVWAIHTQIATKPQISPENCNWSRRNQI